MGLRLFAAAALAAGLMFAPLGQSAAQAAPKYAQNGAVKIHYDVNGKGPLVVLIHGFPDFGGNWKPLTDDLNKAGFRTAAMDLRGYNLSDKPEGVAAYAMPNLIGDVAAVIAAEGQKEAIVIGHDWGAAIAWQVAMNRPDLVRRLVILSVPHPAGFAREMATNKAQQANSQYARNFQQPGFEKNLKAEQLAGWMKDPALKGPYVEALKRSDFGAMLNYYRANYPSGAGEQTTVPAGVATNQRVKVPTLVLHGMKDTALHVAGHSGTWDHVDADTTIVVFPQAGHFVQHDAKDQVNRTIKDWLKARP